MKLIKNMFKTLLILIGILAMVALFGFAIMMIFHVSLFGYTYVKYDNDAQIEFAKEQVDTLTTIDLTTTRANVVIAYTSQSTAKSMLVSNLQNFQGIFKDTVKRVGYTDPNSEEKKPGYKLKIENGVLKIETIEPDGLYLVNDNKIKIYLPQNKLLTDLKINSGAKVIDIGENKNFTVQNLTILANKSILPNNVTISDKLTVQGDLTLKTNLGKITINSTINGNVNINSNAGSITFNTNVAGNVNVSGKSPAVEFGHLPMDLKFNNDFDISDVKQYNILGNLVIDNCSGAGNVKVSGTVNGYVYIYNPDIEFWARNVNNSITCQGGANNIRVFGKLDGITSTINCGNGYLYLNNTYSVVNAESTMNSVEIKNARNDVTINNTRGDIVVQFADGVTKKLVATTQTGSIKATNLRGEAKLTANGGNVTASFENVTGNSEIKAKYRANVTIADNITYNFTARAKTATVNVQLGSVIYKNWNDAENIDGWKTKTNVINYNGSSPSNSLTVSVTDNGSITAKMPD